MRCGVHSRPKASGTPANGSSGGPSCWLDNGTLLTWPRNRPVHRCYRCRRPSSALRVRVHLLRAEEGGGAALRLHHPVVLVEVLVGAARGGEDLSQEQPQPLGVDG